MESKRVGHDWVTFTFHKTNLVKKEVLIFFECFTKFIYYKITGCLNFIFVVLWFIIRNIYLVFIYSSWHRAPKLFGFLVMRAVKVSCYINGTSMVAQMVKNPPAMWDLGSIPGLFNEVTLGPQLSIRAGAWRTNHWLESWNFIYLFIYLPFYFVLEYSPLGYDYVHPRRH